MKTLIKTIGPLFALPVLTALAYAGPLDNCSEYTKMGTPSERGTLLCRKGYALAHNPKNKTPDWVAEHLTKEKASAHMGRKNYFAPDPDLPKGERAELTDYKDSGFDRGHMAPAADMRWDMKAYKECFYLSNMVPQVGPGMNQGIWKNLEEKVRKWAITRGELYIYTGPIYDEPPDALETIGDNEVAIPTHLYKIIYDPKRKEAIAFLMPNEELETKNMPQYLVSVDKVEKETGLDFLSALNLAEQKRIESSKAVGLWK
jgi:endonuclease G